MPKVPGFDIPVPGENELRPHHRDQREDKGVLSHVQPVNMVMDFGAPRDALTDWRGVPSPASATFKAGVVAGVNPSMKPEEKTARIHTGITASERSKKQTAEEKKKGGHYD